VAAPVDAVVPLLAALPALEAVAAVFDMLYISKCENFFFRLHVIRAQINFQ